MSVVETIRGLTNTYHAYVFGTAFWYSLRAFMRIVSPETVAEWFRPPAQSRLTSLGTKPNDLELYNIRTDAWGLVALALVLIVLADAVPLPDALVGSSMVKHNVPAKYKKPYARAAVLITIFHHITTGIGAWQHWRLPSHHTTAMDIGVWGNVGLTALGVAALVWGLADDGEVAAGERKKE